MQTGALDGKRAAKGPQKKQEQLDKGQKPLAAFFRTSDREGRDAGQNKRRRSEESDEGR